MGQFSVEISPNPGSVLNGNQHGIEHMLDAFPSPDELWARQRAAEGLNDPLTADRLLTPSFPDRAKPLRYYQEIAVNRAVQAVLQGRKRILLTLCTGAGKVASTLVV